MLWKNGRVEGASGWMGLEALEPRLVLAGTPFPDMALLESATNSVIRFETTFGDVDIEMFDSAAPITVTNFVKYVTSGRLDNTFIHRRTDMTAEGLEVLQGGGYTFTNSGGLNTVSTDAPIVLESTGRQNLARTIAMARTNAPNSATSQFFINTSDNAVLNPTGPGTGYAVFGRVIQGWTAFLNMLNQPVEDLRSEPAFAGPQSGAFGTVPVSNNYTPAGGVREDALLYVLDAELIKPAGATSFFNQQLIMPEGHRTPSATETLELINPNAGAATYQIIARYETGARDVVIASGTINAQTTLRLPISVAGQTTPNLVRADAPYALEIQTSVDTAVATPLAITGAFRRTDFHAETSIPLTDPAHLSDSAKRSWGFSRIERNSLSFEFLVWYNLGESPANVTVTFYTDSSATPTSVTFVTPAQRRGGVEVFNIPNLPVGILGAKITSSQPIIAALSDWDLPEVGVAADQAYTPGWAFLGIPGGGSTAGGLANVDLVQGSTNVLGITNPNPQVAVVTFTFFDSINSQPVERVVILTANRRQDLDLTTIPGLTMGERYSVRYSSGTAGIAVQYTSVNETGRNQAVSGRDNAVSTHLSSRSVTSWMFGDGYVDPTISTTQQKLTLSLFSPFARVGTSLNYEVLALFSDGTSLALASGGLSQLGRLDISLGDNNALLAKAQTGTQFRHFTIQVRGTITGTSSGDFANAGFAQLTYRDSLNGRSFTTLPAATDAGRDLANDPIFLP